MTPAEKAKELVDKMNVIHYLKGNGLPVSMHKTQIKQCALIAVDEILNLCWGGNKVGVKHWQEVKIEIEKL